MAQGRSTTNTSYDVMRRRWGRRLGAPGSKRSGVDPCFDLSPSTTAGQAPPGEPPPPPRLGAPPWPLLLMSCPSPHLQKLTTVSSDHPQTSIWRLGPLPLRRGPATIAARGSSGGERDGGVGSPTAVLRGALREESWGAPGDTTTCQDKGLKVVLACRD
jgi:hypothetical protein